MEFGWKQQTKKKKNTKLPVRCWVLPLFISMQHEDNKTWKLAAEEHLRNISSGTALQFTKMFM